MLTAARTVKHVRHDNEGELGAAAVAQVAGLHKRCLELGAHLRLQGVRSDCCRHAAATLRDGV